jgi:hypothetical protein
MRSMTTGARRTVAILAIGALVALGLVLLLGVFDDNGPTGPGSTQVKVGPTDASDGYAGLAAVGIPAGAAASPAAGRCSASYSVCGGRGDATDGYAGVRKGDPADYANGTTYQPVVAGMTPGQRHGGPAVP